MAVSGLADSASRFLYVYDDLLSPAQCSMLIEHFKKSHMESIDNGVALYKRVVCQNAVWADAIFQAIQPYLPAGCNAVGCNEYFRFSEYEPGGHFNIHRDAGKQDANGLRSIMTVNIFLNDDFTGGCTDFYLEDKQTLRMSVKPQPGRAAIFNSQHYHVGQVVETGRKYLLRTDVMADLL